MQTTKLRVRDVPFDEGPGACDKPSFLLSREARVARWNKYRGKTIEVIAAPLDHPEFIHPVTCPGPFFTVLNWDGDPTVNVVCPHDCEID